MAKLLWTHLLGVRMGESSCRWEPGTERRRYGGHSGRRSPSSLAPAMCRARMTEVISPFGKTFIPRYRNTVYCHPL
jgi:hypothetical protein